MELTEAQKLITDVYFNILRATGKLPSYVDFMKKEVTKDAIRHNFGNLTELHELIERDFPDTLTGLIAHESHIFNERRVAELSENMRQYKKFFITTAVNGKPVHEGFLETIREWCAQFNAGLIIIPCADVASTRTSVRWTFDKELSNEFFVSSEFKLNENLFISNIKVSAKQILPTTGLARIGQRNGTTIFASPKQFLDYVATSSSGEKLPKAVMTTGAVTLPNYDNEKYMSARTSYIAESDHVMGGIIVELVDDKKFHFRQVQANNEGEFVDLGIRYFPDGSEEPVTTHMYFGDWHSGQVDPVVREGLYKLLNNIRIDDVYVGDWFDGRSISHHDKNRSNYRAEKSMKNDSNLGNELLDCTDDINEIIVRIHGRLNLIQGNHDDVLYKWVDEGRFLNDPENYYIGVKTAAAKLDGENPLEYAFKTFGGEYNQKLVTFIPRDKDVYVGGVQVGQHGDLGPNGSRASLSSLEKAYGNCIVGHSHSAAILRGVFRVGTFTKLKLSYNIGPSSWTHTGCLIYEDGSRQLINIIDGEYTTPSE